MRNLSPRLVPGVPIRLYVDDPTDKTFTFVVGVRDKAQPFAAIVYFVHPGASHANGVVDAVFWGHEGTQNYAHSLPVYREQAPEGTKGAYGLWGTGE